MKILKYQFWIIEAIGLGVLVWLIAKWNVILPQQRVCGMFFVAIVLHIIEEMKLPGGFVDGIVRYIKLPVMDMEVPKTLLSCLILYLAFIPLFFPKVTFMAAAPLFLGVIELFAHLLSAAKMNPTGKFYSPGLVSALVIMLPMTVYGFYVIISNHIVTGWNWLWSFLYLVIPLFTVQQFIVKRSGMNYSEFVGNALSVLFGKKEKNCNN